MSSTGAKKQELPYMMKGIPIHAFLTETGEFRWIPNASACGDKGHALEIHEVLAKMPEDKRQVWVTRFDAEKTIAVCPIIREDKDLSQAFAELFNLYIPSKPRDTRKPAGGEGTK